MTDHQEIYQNHAENYDPLIQREDYQGNILKALQSLILWEGKDVVDTGAGTGRLVCLLSPFVRSIQAFDKESAMLEIARKKLIRMGTSNWTIGVADHRSLPVADQSIDVVVSGWSVCYFIHWDKQNWKGDVERTLNEMKRILRPGGMIILLETQGTGFSEPNPPEHLRDYFDYLSKRGFKMEWIRTDYRFQSVEEAVRLSRFFFGEEMAARVSGNNSVVLPECTGIWWKRLD